MARADRGGLGGAQGPATLSDRETIVALSSGRLPAAIAVMRISGPAARRAGSSLTGTLPPPRRASLRALHDADGELLDRALVLVFPAETSATGEDLVELHCHGGRAVVAEVERALLACDGVRAAQPGEFSRRALLNGRIDLSQAQGLADLLEAETESERRLAMRNAEGAVRRLIEGWMARLTDMAAQVEASIDFAEEGDVVAEAASLAAIDDERRALAADIDRVLAAPPIERWRDGWRIVIAGPPNAGKSTLLNLMVQRDAAIVSAEAGTTRDRIDAPIQRNGVGYVVSDTAGLRDAPGAIEALGIARANDAVATADLVLWLGDEAPPVSGALWIHARADMIDRHVPIAGTTLAVRRDDAGSIDRLWQAIERRVVPLAAYDQPALHRADREKCMEVAELIRVANRDVVILSDTLRRCRSILSTILGTNATEELLDRLFARFCLGK